MDVPKLQGKGAAWFSGVCTWESVGLGARMAKNGDEDALWRRICRPIAVAMGQKAAGAGCRSAILQPAILKSDS